MIEQRGESSEEPVLHALVLVFIPEDEWTEMGGDAVYGRCYPYYPHDDEMGIGFEDNRVLVPHTWMGRVALILPGGVFEGFLEGQAPAIPSWFEDWQPTVSYRRLGPGATCFAIITAEGQWVECYEAEAGVLLREQGDELVPVNPVRSLTRAQVKWRHYVAGHAQARPREVIVPCDAYLRLSNTIDLARGTRSGDIDAIGS